MSLLNKWWSINLQRSKLCKLRTEWKQQKICSSFHWWENKRRFSCHPFKTLPLFSVSHQMPAFIPLIVSVMVSCKPQTRPHPASLTSTAVPSIPSVYQNSLMVFLYPCLRAKASPETLETSACSSFCSLTLWNTSVSVRPGFSHSAWRAYVVFITQIKAVKRSCISWQTLIQRAHKCSAFCHPFVPMWSHISHLSLLGSYNLPEAFSRNPTDSVIWSALWLFITEFTHLWEEL